MLTTGPGRRFSASTGTSPCARLTIIPSYFAADRGMAMLAHVLRSNNAPTDVEFRMALALLDSKKALSIHWSLYGLNESLGLGVSLEADIILLSSVVHPQRKLCAELMERIFLEAFHSGLQDATMASYNGELLPPWSLLHVCHRWNTVLYNYRALWTQVNVDLDSVSYGQHLETYSNHIVQQLSLSVNMPLDVVIQCSNPCLPFSHLHLFKKLQDSVPRWRYLNITVPFMGLAAIVGSAPRFAVLTTIQICVTDMPVWPTPILATAPVLSEIYATPESLTAIGLPLAQVSMYHACHLIESEHIMRWPGLHQATLMPVLSQFHSLTTLRVRSSGRGIQDNLAHFHSTTLTELQCSFHMLRYLHCPNLTYLDIVGDRTVFSDIKAPRLLRFLGNNAQHVTNFILRDPYFQISLARVLAVMPLVEELHITDLLLDRYYDHLVMGGPAFLHMQGDENARIAAVEIWFDILVDDWDPSFTATSDNHYTPLTDSEDELTAEE